MKKILASIITVLFCTMFASAQALDAQRIANLQKLVDKAPKACGIADVDGYASAAGAAAILAITNSKQLEQFSEAIKGGNPPALADVEALARTIAGEKDAIKAATDLAPKAASALKDESEKAKSGSMKEKMEAGKRVKNADKAISYANDAVAMTTQESVAQGMAVADMLASLKK